MKFAPSIPHRVKFGSPIPHRRRKPPLPAKMIAISVTVCYSLSVNSVISSEKSSTGGYAPICLGLEDFYIRIPLSAMCMEDNTVAVPLCECQCDCSIEMRKQRKVVDFFAAIWSGFFGAVYSSWRFISHDCSYSLIVMELNYTGEKGPLANNPVTDFEKAVNKLRRNTGLTSWNMTLKRWGVVMLPNMFAKDFGDQITRFATLIDPKNNKFEVLVERVNGHVFFLPKDGKLYAALSRLGCVDVIFGTEPYEHCRIGGKWKLFVDCCNLYEEMRMRFGAPVCGKNTALYVKVVAN
ncbi:hypothetical protein MTR_5g058370 [Medicago truncatula]|uniref:Uncharacterized protein n=1 Tax=Medicago truncatula TaxID=3880 RepID=G7K8R9_MEDTR|nr:hypothetical protein MTR_5g058370 [Medicago truncatula]